MKYFGLIGGGGYIAPRHMKAIKDTGNTLEVVYDRNDSIGILDSHFPDADFVTDYERFDQILYRKKKMGRKVDYIAICSPNYLHGSHIHLSLKNQADAICEKPLVLNLEDIEDLKKVEQETGRRVWNILQLRLHESIVGLKKRVEQELKENPGKIYEIDLTYLTSRGKWYFESWKGDAKKSGGIATNIGVHFYDMITWIFGGIKENIVHVHRDDVASGFLHLDHARVKWFLSVNYDFIPDTAKNAGKRTYRSITCDGEEIEFSEGFTELHTASYKEILSGNGFGLDEATNSIRIVEEIRNQAPVGLKGEYHPFAKKVLQ